MSATKTPGRHSHNKPPILTAKKAVSSGATAQRPIANLAKVAPTVQATRPSHTPPGAGKQVRGTVASTHPATANDTSVGKNGSGKASTKSAQGKWTTPWTIEAASRVASATARHGDGTVKKESFAADAMSKAMKNENNRRGTK